MFLGSAFVATGCCQLNYLSKNYKEDYNPFKTRFVVYGVLFYMRFTHDA